MDELKPMPLSPDPAALHLAAEGDPGSTVCVKGEFLIDVPEICTVVMSVPATSVEYVTVYTFVSSVNVTTGYTALV